VCATSSVTPRGVRDPRHDCGVIREQPGLYFVGLPFQYSMSSGMIQGVGRDAKRIVEETRRSLLVTRDS
jgi:putative flavoprotein involved in K+ transport